MLLLPCCFLYLRGRFATWRCSCFPAFSGVSGGVRDSCFLGSRRGVDNQDVLADLEAIKEVELDKKLQARTREAREVDVELLNRLWRSLENFRYCAWRHAKFDTHKTIAVHYLSDHQVVIQTCGSSPPSIFQTVLEKELQLRMDQFTHPSEEVIEGMAYVSRSLFRLVCFLHLVNLLGSVSSTKASVT